MPVRAAPSVVQRERLSLAETDVMASLVSFSRTSAGFMDAELAALLAQCRQRRARRVATIAPIW
ncbi:hypothetical protein [Rathayibacter iranicus]|uniref:Uncharacterized protein n=1 Tax=Rathayibacter iranicus NCPPB 2253 = VKM Ac-1602 TaxID=1328868 RepID=A0ABX5LK47_9MICO|nr:hypothetical protein [Rathayibacter iranicus]PWJ66916.1 hypothetical protein B0H03_101372 [Rathayibacter iranicus NCPPB 2253 = VKM Ac-1602]